ncbi:hypothetical protein ACVWZA_000623 [Sphingomonas sp. UYAg733]
MFGYILMTVGIVQFTLIPVFADLNRSHAGNPHWPAHARFHVVAQVLTTSAIGILALVFLWGSRVSAPLGVCIAMLLSLIPLLGFFMSAAATPFFGGEISNLEGAARRMQRRVDGNVVNFAISLSLLIGGRLAIW